MDNTDVKILQCLMKNARANSSEIAEKVKLSTSTVIERIKKLENSGVIKGYAAIIVPEKLGKDVTALISVAIDHPKFNDGFVAAVKDNRHIAECLYIAGEFDYFLKVVTDNTKTLESVALQHLWLICLLYRHHSAVARRDYRALYLHLVARRAAEKVYGAAPGFEGHHRAPGKERGDRSGGLPAQR